MATISSFKEEQGILMALLQLPLLTVAETLIHPISTMKIVIIAIIWLFGQKVVAQTTFSISPLVNYKLLICGYGYDQRFGFYSENQPSQIQNPYYAFGAKKISHRPSINVGLRASAALKDDKHLFSIEWSQDEVGTMSKTQSFTTTNTTGAPPAPYNTYGMGVSYFQNSFVFNRFSLSYGYLITKKARNNKLFFTSDVSYARTKDNRMEWVFTNTPDNNAVYYHNNAKWEEIEQTAQLWGGNYLMLGVGLKADISIKVKNNPIYLFSAETNYRQGFKVMVASEQTTLINDSGQLEAFSDVLGSKGSGFYFQLSRRFDLYTAHSKK